jgi:cyclic pyranopterin phosphate synthase
MTSEPPPDPPECEPGLTHLRADGSARMVDVSTRQVTVRSATAEGAVIVSELAYGLVADGSLPKGDAMAVARIAGIMAAKRTPDLVPLCHPIAVTGVEVDVACVDGVVRISATVRTTDRTGVEMEAMTAVAVAGLAVVDMVKAVDPAAVITDVRVLTKSGGRHGDWHRGSP